MRHTSRARSLVAAALGLAAASAMAQPAGPGPDGARAEPLAQRRQGSLARELGLSAAQQEKLREIMDAQRPRREELFQKIANNREALHRLLESGSADASAVGELVLEGRRLHEQSRALRELEQKAIREALTPEQQQKFDTMQQRRRERRPGEGSWPAGGRGPGRPGAQPPRPPPGPSEPGGPPLRP